MARAFSSSSTCAPKEPHEVFISFRSEDTRKTFTSHLNSALTRLDIKTYVDNDNLQRGDEISQSLLRAIEDAKLSVIVFSKNYAASKWCLDELVKILECRRTKGQIIVPIFYDVDPSHVRNRSGTYGEAFEKHMRSEGMKKVLQWREALKEASNHSGWDCTLNRTESEIVEAIAMDVLEKLNRVYVGDLDQEIRKLEQLAQLQHQYFQAIPTVENCRNHQATLKRITEIKMERSIRLLRLTPEMSSYVGNFHSNPASFVGFTSFS